MFKDGKPRGGHDVADVLLSLKHPIVHSGQLSPMSHSAVNHHLTASAAHNNLAYMNEHMQAANAQYQLMEAGHPGMNMGHPSMQVWYIWILGLRCMHTLKY